MKRILPTLIVVATIVSVAPFVTHAVASFFVDSDGFVGIGNSNPQANLWFFL